MILSTGTLAKYFFFLNATATTEIYTLSLHDALPIYKGIDLPLLAHHAAVTANATDVASNERDRKSTRLNSSHMSISYAVFCLKKKTHHPQQPAQRRRI